MPYKQIYIPSAKSLWLNASKPPRREVSIAVCGTFLLGENFCGAVAALGGFACFALCILDSGRRNAFLYVQLSNHPLYYRFIVMFVCRCAPDCGENNYMEGVVAIWSGLGFSLLNTGLAPNIAPTQCAGTKRTFKKEITIRY
jgi:hypothetical protein